MNALTTIRGGAVSLAPTNWSEAQQFAQLLASSTMVPRDFQGKPGNIMVAVQWGAEVGLGPLQAVQNIAVINGRPSIWGDAAIALVRGHPACEYITEGVDGEGEARHGWCEVKRRGAPKPERRTFSVADAKKAGLWGKSGPWQQYPERMLQLRARGFALRDVFPDALRGVITVEEARDIPPEPRFAPNLAADPTPAPAGSMREYAQQITAPKAAETWPIVTPDGEVRQCPRGKWLAGVSKALAMLEDGAALYAWRDAMKPHVEGVAADDEIAAAEADRLIADRLDEITTKEGA